MTWNRTRSNYWRMLEKVAVQSMPQPTKPSTASSDEIMQPIRETLGLFAVVMPLAIFAMGGFILYQLTIRKIPMRDRLQKTIDDYGKTQ